MRMRVPPYRPGARKERCIILLSKGFRTSPATSRRSYGRLPRRLDAEMSYVQVRMMYQDGKSHRANSESFHDRQHKALI